ncbi:putative heme biosynthesis protein (nirD/L) [Candidatus Competibacter denitrificans Run_A_D11]|uniref:siroheme decarboxylase n=1 Tax=Candidatus Competibacter denitrificans Run_A_D11 TaxID=1400863 RepID=W6M910_9GAMM|nr:Lrp/AsnC family transcriptional regulator [Candidatus Competibacter denitrificans]CDI04491.1 putative heme biosynthesis protein (nirD/L) [Candidatus Competibacter denitrificans Run_A_D11]
MNELKRRLIDEWQGGFPLVGRPFAVVAERLDSDEEAVLAALRDLLADGTLTRFGPLYQIERLGGAFSLAAVQAPEADFERITTLVNAFPEVAHNYRRNHAFNMWFVLATETPAQMQETVERIAAATGLPVFNFPKEREYFIEARFTVGARSVAVQTPSPPTPLPQGMRGVVMAKLRPLILATQAGLPLTLQPYHALAAQLGSDAATVIAGLQSLLDAGAIRRIGVVPNHYRIGYAANGMTVWDVPDDAVDALGEQIGALEFVTHCYRRPRHLPDWPYNLFAMAHGASREEVAAKADCIADVLGDACRHRAILYSTQILKKTGLRLSGTESATLRG